MSAKKCAIYMLGGMLGSAILSVIMDIFDIPPEIVIVPVCLYMAFGIWYLGWK